MMDTSDSFMKNGPEGTFGHTGFTGTSIVVIPSHHISSDSAGEPAAYGTFSPGRIL